MSFTHKIKFGNMEFAHKHFSTLKSVAEVAIQDCQNALDSCQRLEINPPKELTDKLKEHTIYVDKCNMCISMIEETCIDPPTVKKRNNPTYIKSSVQKVKAEFNWLVAETAKTERTGECIKNSSMQCLIALFKHRKKYTNCIEYSKNIVFHLTPIQIVETYKYIFVVEHRIATIRQGLARMRAEDMVDKQGSGWFMTDKAYNAICEKLETI